MNIDWHGTWETLNPFAPGGILGPKRAQPAPVKNDIRSLWDPSTQGEFMQSTAFAPFAGHNHGVAESNQMFDSFLAWKKSRDEANQEHAQYLQLIQASPGRSATILTDPNAEINPTMLTQSGSRTRTVLG